MFEQLRQDRAAGLVAAQQQLASTEGSLQPLRDQVASHQAQLAVAQNALEGVKATAQRANANRDAAQNVVNQRQAERNAAAAALGAAIQNRNDLVGDEPDNPLPNGKPNPAHGVWRIRLAQATARVNDAQAALNQADAALAQANQARDAAAITANAAAAATQNAQAAVSAESQSLSVVQSALALAQGSLSGLRAAVDNAQSALSAIDARQARLVAEPLDRADLEVAVETEVAELTEQRRQRHDRLLERAALMAQKATLLTAHDADVAALVPVRNAIAGWGEAGRFSSLATARAALDAVIAAAHAQQDRPATDRTDDLAAARSAATQAAANLTAALNQALTERQQQVEKLATAAQLLATHQQEHP